MFNVFFYLYSFLSTIRERASTAHILTLSFFPLIFISFVTDKDNIDGRLAGHHAARLISAELGDNLEMYQTQQTRHFGRLILSITHLYRPRRFIRSNIGDTERDKIAERKQFKGNCFAPFRALISTN